MITRYPITKARINLGDLVKRAHLNNEFFILEKGGIPVAGIINIDELEDYLELRDPKLKAQIKDGYEAYRRGKARPASAFLADLAGTKTRKRKR